MRIGVLGTGTVGQAIATRCAGLGHEVTMGARDAANPRAAAWAEAHGGQGGRAGSFADAASAGEVVVNATAGTASLDVLAAAGAEHLAGKVVVDIANALDFSTGAPRLALSSDDSLGEQIQRAFPDARVVKALNTMNAAVMVDPASVPGDHVVLVAGDDADAKTVVTELLGEFGWPAERVVDLGGIASARATELYLPLWLSLMGALGTATFNIGIHRAG